MFHRITLIGNLGRDPELRYTPTGQEVANFSVAVTEKWKGQDEQVHERTLWYRVTAWGRMAEVVNQYLSKGAKVYVEGRLQADAKTGGPRLYQRQDGTHGASFEVTASTIKFLSTKGGNGAAAEAEVEAEAEAEGPDIPF